MIAVRFICVLAVVAAAVSALPHVRDADGPAVLRHVVDKVNSANAGWTATVENNFKHVSMGSFVRLLGVSGRAPDLPVVRWTVDVDGLPANFDARDKWSGCIGDVLDQADCGSCWAFGAVEVASDRLCISGGQNASFVQLAPLDLVACDSGLFKANHGCEGGQPGSAMEYIKSTGLVDEACLPYLKSEGGPIPTCTDEPCLDFVKTPKCSKSCANGESFEDSKRRFKQAYSVHGNEASIAQEIMTNGPVEGTITVYEDFVTYKSGVYRHTTGSALGGHAIKIIGFGTEDDGTKYWTIQNSWTHKWGDNGYVKILRGVDEIGIESGAVAGTF